MKGRCPTPGKRAYASRKEARHYGRVGGLRAYRCDCGCWHLSKIPAPPEHTKRRRRKKQAR